MGFGKDICSRCYKVPGQLFIFYQLQQGRFSSSAGCQFFYGCYTKPAVYLCIRYKLLQQFLCIIITCSCQQPGHSFCISGVITKQNTFYGAYTAGFQYKPDGISLCIFIIAFCCNSQQFPVLIFNTVFSHYIYIGLRSFCIFQPAGNCFF